MKKVLSLILATVILASTSVNAMKPKARTARTAAPAAEAVAPVAEAVAPVAEAVAPVAEAVAPVAEAVAPAAEANYYMSIVKENPKITTAAVASVVLVLSAIYGRKAVSANVVKAAAWMKKNKATSVAIITTIVVLGSAAFVYYNAQEGQSVWGNTKHAGNVALDGICAIPSNIKTGAVAAFEWSKEHYIVTLGLTALTAGATFVAYDLGKEDSYLKSLVSGVYSNATSKVVATK